MTTRNALSTAVVALAVVLAGCGAPVAQSESGTEMPDTTTPTTQQETATAQPAAPTNDTGESTRTITVANGSLSIDPDVVFDRVQQLRDSDVDRPRVVEVYNSPEAFENESSGVGVAPNREFYELAGMTTRPVNTTTAVTRQKNGYVTGLGAIVLYVGENASRVDELLLTAHEFTHYLQLQTGRQEQLAGSLDGATLTDERYVLRAVIEGGAVVTTNAYLERHANTTATNSEMYTGLQSALPEGHVARYENGKYVNGDDYMDDRSDAPADLAAVYENPPRTSEQLLHGLSPGTEPPTPLAVDVETGDEWVTSGHDRMGEAFVRTALEATVGTREAVTAATGWGNDSVRFLRPTDGGETAYAWVLRWDDAANQSEFQSAYETALDRRGTETDGVWTLEDDRTAATLLAPTEQSSVVVFGPRVLVENVSVAGTSGSVTVSTP
jgi:hypothetical protein